MRIVRAGAQDVEATVRSLVAAFAEDPLTGYLMQPGEGYEDRLAQFFSLLMRARLALDAPVLVAKPNEVARGVAMGYATGRPAWPEALAEAWRRFERSLPDMVDRMAAYDEIAARFAPEAPHYYLGVLGLDPSLHGQGVGGRLLREFCAVSAADPRSHGVYLETAKPSNVPYYERAGFVQTGDATLGNIRLWCLYLPHSERTERTALA